ncbi:hypothetical protein, partial [Couchioplanes caeruleus]
MLRRLSAARGLRFCLGLLILLLAGAAGAGWWNARTQDRVQGRIAELAEIQEAVENIRYSFSDVSGYQGPPLDADAVEAIKRAQRASVYESLDSLRIAALTADERATAQPLRQAVDVFFAADDKLDDLARRDTDEARTAAMEIINSDEVWEATNQVDEITDLLLEAIEARSAALHEGMKAAGAAGNATLAAALLLALPAGVAMIRAARRSA